VSDVPAGKLIVIGSFPRHLICSQIGRIVISNEDFLGDGGLDHLMLVSPNDHCFMDGPSVSDSLCLVNVGILSASREDENRTFVGRVARSGAVGFIACLDA